MAVPAPSYQVLAGVGDLGRCVNIFDRYEIPNRQQLVDLKTGSATFDWYGFTYALPNNLPPPQVVAAGSAKVEHFSSKEEFSSFLSAKAGLQGSYEAFKAEFSAAFSVKTGEEAEYSYSMLHVEYDSYQLALGLVPQTSLVKSVLQDSVYADLPASFDPKNPYPFFRFFDRYGTHYVSAVTCGGRLYMFSKIEKSYAYSDTSAEANLKAEFSALLGGVTGNTQANWNAVDKNWFTAQSGYVQVLGGDTGILSILFPSWGDVNVAAYRDWLGSIGVSPATRDFTLRPISDIFPPEKQAAVSNALDAYRGNQVRVEAIGGQNVDSCSAFIALNGRPISSTTSNGQLGGMLMAVYDRATLAVLHSGTYDIQKNRINEYAADGFEPYADAAYGGAMKDAQPYVGRSDVIVAMVFYGINSLYSYPSSAFYTFMESLGAADDLAEWTSKRTSAAATDMAYALVGIPDGRHGDLGLEALMRGTQDYTFYAGLPLNMPGLKMDIYLQPDVSQQISFTPH